MNTYSHGELPKGRATTILKKLLGSLELEIMELMWQLGEATVRQVAKAIDRKRPIAYTTVMTVMGHLVDKKLLTRTMDGKSYHYRIIRSKNEFLRETSRSIIRTLVDDFGDLAIAEFLGEIGEIDADKLKQLRSLVKE